VAIRKPHAVPAATPAPAPARKVAVQRVSSFCDSITMGYIGNRQSVLLSFAAQARAVLNTVMQCLMPGGPTMPLLCQDSS
jgi:hypothetical protein